MASRGVLLALAVLFAAPTALAAPSAAERETARRLMDEGKARVKQGDLERALEAYEKAHDIMHVPTTGLALAKTHYALGHLVEARDLALEVLRFPREPSEPAVFEAARKQAKELDAQLKGRIPTVKVRIRGAPPAKVVIDGVEIPTPLIGEPIAVNPGSRVIVAKTAEGAEAKTQIAVAEKDAKEIDLELAPSDAADDASEKSTPRAITGPSLGDDGSRGQRTSAANVLVYGGFSIALIGVGVGAATGALALSKAGDVKPRCENNVCDPAVSADLESARSLATMSNIAFAVGAGGLVLGIVGLALPKSRRTDVAFWVTPMGGGIRGVY